VFGHYPKLEQIKYKLIENGCESAAMSGSGSTMIGILESKKDFERIKNKIGYPCMLVSSAQGSQCTELSRKEKQKTDTAYHERTESFRWNSKQELCDFFNRQFGLTRKIVESEINEVMKTFRLRQGEAVTTQELWQKVGINLEKKIRELDSGK
jgi:hypothetical protein